MITDKNILKINRLYTLTILAIMISLGFPIINFLFFSPYYDRSGEWLHIPNQAKKEIYQGNIALINQHIYSISRNLARITIQARWRERIDMELSLMNDEKHIVRRTIKPRIIGNKIIWEFTPLKDSSNKTYDLIIINNNQEKKTVQLSLCPTNDKNSSIKINKQILEGKSLAFFIESKFTGPKEKIITFYKRILTYKPALIQWLFFPTLTLFFILFIGGLKFAIKIILTDDEIPLGGKDDL